MINPNDLAHAREQSEQFLDAEQEAKVENLKQFDHPCTCGGYAWSMNGRDPAHPHMDWCPQREQYEEWRRATHGTQEAMEDE